MPGGRPSKYSQQVADRLIEELGEGKSIRQICKAHDMPSAKTVNAWFHRYPELRRRYLGVCETREMYLIDEILADGPDAFMSPAARHAADTAIWKLRRMQPKARKPVPFVLYQSHE